MAIRVKHNVLVQISADTDAKRKHYYPETKEVVIDAFDKTTNRNFTVASAASEALDLSDITDVRGLYLEVDGDVDVIINGSATPISLKRSSTGTGVVAKLFLEASISSITIDNTAGSSAVNGEMAIWGDPTP